MHDLGQPFQIHRATVVVDIPFEAGHDEFVVGQLSVLLGLKPGWHRVDIDFVASVVVGGSVVVVTGTVVSTVVVVGETTSTLIGSQETELRLLWT